MLASVFSPELGYAAEFNFAEHTVPRSGRHTGARRAASPSNTASLSASFPHAATTPAPAATQDVRVQWKGSEGVIVTFTDKKSGEVVRQIPPEQVLSVARFIRQRLDEEAASKDRTQS